MKRQLLILGFVALLVGGTALPATLAADKAKPPCNVILVGWDGAQRNHTFDLLKAGKLPVLKKLADTGSLVEIDIQGTTDTKAGWTQILTGYYPNVTGVWSNGQYQPIPKGLSIGERLENLYGDGIDTVAVVGKKGHVDADPPQKVKVKDPAAAKPAAKKAPAAKKGAAAKKGKKRRSPGSKIIEEDGVFYRVRPGKPHLNMSQTIDFWKNGLIHNEDVMKLALEKLTATGDKPFFYFVHFADPDHTGHKYGENSEEYSKKIIDDDKCTGLLIEKLKKMGVWENTLLMVVVDHGFDEGGKSHKNAPYVFAASNKKILVRDGLRQDIAPTVLEAYGFDLAKIKPALDGISLTKPAKRKNPTIGPAFNEELRAKARK